MNRVRLSAASRRPTAIDVLRTLYIHSTLAMTLLAYVLLAGPFLFLAAITFDRRRRLARRLACMFFPRWIRHYCQLAGNPLQLDVSKLILPHTELGPCIIVANHSSAMDVILLMLLPPGFGDGRVWAKGWPFREPLLGWLMYLSGHLHIENFNLLPDARDLLTDGQSMLVFPESSRSRTGRVGRFRDGAFLLAARTGRPIIPVAIHGSHACMPPGQPFIFHPDLRIEVLGILRAGDGLRAHIELKQRAHAMIESALEGRRIQQVAA
jgi:1-acyl-sn-glycerol-3-phosphate acyltransferase